MTPTRSPLAVALAAILALAAPAPLSAQETAPPIPATSGIDADVFTPGMAQAGPIRLHYVRGGPEDAQTLVLLPGWPETWYAWRKMMPELAETYDVIAFDPPGLGASDMAVEGYDTGTVARRVHQALAGLGVEEPHHLVAHDVGTWIAYSYAAAYPDAVDRMVLMDAAVPGLNLQEAFTLENAPRLFQFFFNAVEDLPETLTTGREEAFLGFFFDSKSLVAGAIDEEDRAVYLDTYTQPDRMTAGFEYYRAVPTNAQVNAGAAFAMPILALGAESGVKGGLARALRDGPAPQAVGGEVAGCGHYMPEECPAVLLERMEAFFAE